MALLIGSVAGDVLRAVGIEVHEGRLIAVHRFERGCLNGKLAGGETTELRILLPQVGLNELRCRCEAQEGHVT